MSRSTICTIVSKNYLAYARVLSNTFLRHHPDGQIFVLLVDEIDGYFDPAGEPFITIPIKDIGISDFSAMLFRYTVLELNTAVKPYFLEYLFKTYGCDKLCYFDPDITIHHPLDEIFSLLDHNLMVLVPHLLDFLEDGRLPDEPYILRSGVYNLGFVGVAKHPELWRFLHWWQRRLEKHCLVDVAQGLFTDQRWMDLAPGFFDDVYIHRDPGCNVAYWNLNHRRLEKAGDGYWVNGAPLKFFHFSGFSVANIEMVSKHQDRFTLQDLPEARSLFQQYRTDLLNNGYDVVKNWPYAFGYFQNRVKIPDIARYLWREAEENQSSWPDPFSTDSPHSYLNWLNQPVDKPGTRRSLITQLALAIYCDREDIQRAFPDLLRLDRKDFAKWFVEQAPQEYGLDPFFTEPVAASLVKPDSLKRTEVSPDKAQPRLPPDNEIPHTRARVYLKIRDFLNSIGVGQRLRAVIGPEQVLKIRQLFFFGRANLALLPPQAARIPPANSVFKEKSISSHKLGLNIVGYLRDETGVGEVARSIVKALYQKNFPVAQTNIDSYSARQDDVSTLHLPFGNPHSINLFNVNADQVPIIYEGLGANFFKGRYNIGFWFWELAHFPAVWQDNFRYFDEIWVGSNFSQSALAQVSPIPVVNVHVPIINPTPPTVTRRELGLPEDKHIFLFAFDGLSYIERKNPFAVVQAYRTAFEPYFKDTLLVIKATNLDHNPEMAQLLRTAIETASGVLIECYLSRDELNGLFYACDTYVSLHRSEGFGMTIAETMAMGKPVIATAYSANMDFMNPANSYPVAYRLIELEKDYGPYQKGNLWAEPDINEAAAIMRRVVDHPEEARRKGEFARQDIEQFYGAEVVAQHMIRRLKKIEGWRQLKQTG